MSGEVKTAGRLEAGLERLEQIVAALEREDLELEQALALFEEGVGHLRAAREILKESELRIDRLLADAAGEPVVEPARPDGE